MNLPNDIAHCLNQNCPLRETCQRFTAVVTADGWVTYGEFQPKDGQCEHYIKVKP